MKKKLPSDKMTKEELIAEVQVLREQLSLLQEKSDDYQILLDESSDPIFMFYPDGTYRYVNKAFANGVGRRTDEIIGFKIWDIFSKEGADKRFAVVKWVFENGKTKKIEVRVPRPDGDYYYLTTAKPIINEMGKVTSVICISKEITERKRMEDDLLVLSTHDALTGLYNRRFFQTELDRIQDSRLFPVSIVIADLDDLKIINDERGHQTGDEVIIKAANLLKSIFRTEDIIARIGGDEFGIILTETIETAVSDIVVRFNKEMGKQQDPLLSLSMGWSTAMENDSLEALMHQADVEMYREKVKRKKKLSK